MKREVDSTNGVMQNGKSD